MGLITTEVEVTVNNRNIKYYESLGYVIPKHHSPYAKNQDKMAYDTNAKIIVKVSDLPKNSHYKIDCTCDYCGRLLHIKYQDYNKAINATIKKVCCKQCLGKKNVESNLINYGCENVMQVNEIQQKQLKTCMEHWGVPYYAQTDKFIDDYKAHNLEKFGVEWVFQNDEIKEKAINTCREHWGVDNPFQSDEIKQKINATLLQQYGTIYVSQSEEIKEKKRINNLNRYGYEYTLQIPEVRESIKETNLMKYGHSNYLASQEGKERVKQINLDKFGYENPFESPEIKEKIRQTYYNNGSVNTSSQQKYLNSLFKTILNYPILYWNVDMFDKYNNLIIEYNGGGHALKVKIGEITQDEFEQKEIVRNNMIKRAGYKMMTIISTTDKLPFDNILLGMLDDAKQYFSDYPNHSWITFNIDEGTVESAEFKRSYFYGELRKIKKSA